jgi:hypothetical protein
MSVSVVLLPMASKIMRYKAPNIVGRIATAVTSQVDDVIP